jgi:glycosyltransferase involved in cell wall biosynthesis
MFELGADPGKVVSLRPCSLPRWFTRPAEPAPLDWTASLAAFDAEDEGDIAALYLDAASRAAFDPEAPTIGAYGKVGETKGTYDLLAALGKLAEEGRRFNVLWMAAGSHGRLEPFFEGIRRLRDRHPQVTVLPPLAPWRVPQFLARCHMTCVLERRFPVKIHAPRLPREVLAAGSALVISREVAAKQTFAANLVHGKNCMIVEDPSEIEPLRQALADLLDAPELTRYVRRHGKYLSETVEALLEPGNNVLNALTDIVPELARVDA